MRTPWRIILVTLIVAIAALFLWRDGCAADDTGAMLAADGGFFAVIGPGQEAEIINGLGAGVNYRPLVNDSGITRPSRLIFSVLFRQGDPNVGKGGILCQITQWEGVSFFLGASAMGIGDDLANIEVGGMLESAAEFEVGNQAISFKLGGGYLSSSRYPIYASIGMRTP